jgi:hypothetical protein
MTKRTRAYFIWAGIGMGIAAAFVAVAQEPEPAGATSRGLQSQVFLGMRPDDKDTSKAGAKGNSNTSGRTGAGASTKNGPSKGNGVLPAQADTFLGLTLWQMVLATPDAPVKSRGFTHPQQDKSGTKDWTARRILLNKPVHENDFVVFTFESAPQGYLYVLDRDAFSDGSFGDPILIFPTKRIREGRYDVEPGHLVQIPDPTDHPPALQVDPAKPGQTGIQLIVIGTPQKIPELQPGDDQKVIPAALLARWQKQWASNVEVTTDPKLDGVAITLAEQAALSDLNRPLGPKDNAPTALFHRRGPAGQPIYITTTLPLEPAVKKP